MDMFEQRIVMKFLFLQGSRYKAIYTEIDAVLHEQVFSLATLKRWFQRFKQCDFDVSDEIRQGRPLLDLRETISQFLKDEPFLSARVFAKRLAASPHTVKEVLRRDLRLKKFTRRWVPHERSLSNKAKTVDDTK
jgi:transposase